MIFMNPKATRRRYDAQMRGLLSIEHCLEARLRLSSWNLLSMPTPLRSLPGLAASLRIGSLSVKDESERSFLGSFKALGAPNALIRLVNRRWPDRGWQAADLFSGMHAGTLEHFTVISATDGNHGRALAAASQSIGCKCVIVLHANVSVEREQAIAAFGADIRRIPGNYDDSVSEAARLAMENGWEVVSDTSYEGYEEVPRDVMQGYGVIAHELVEAGGGAECPWTHVFLQGGVGGLAAGLISYLWETYGAGRPIFVVVEPEQADCLLQSAIAQRPSRSRGSIDSVMAGLACGEASPLAWQVLQDSVDVFMTAPDAGAKRAMQMLASGFEGDIPIVAGESGVAGVAALELLAADPELRKSVALGPQARVLLISTEGATAPGVYSEITGYTADAVYAAQQQWLAQHQR